MATKYVSSSNLAYFYGKIKTSIDSKLDASKAYKHPNSGVTAGTYRSITVNAQGHVTAGTNPTTLAGYGITDAAAKNHTHNYAGSSSAGGSANSAVKLATARAINGVNFDGTGNITITANPTPNQLTNQKLNDITTPGFYYAGGSNSVTNKPDGVDPFGMLVMKNASGYTEQILIDSNQKIYIRMHNASTWSNWSALYTTLNKPSKSDVGLGSVENKSSATIRGELTKANVTTALGYTPPTTNTTYNTGDTTTAGITKLYTDTGSNTDGAMTQKATTDALNGKASSSHTHSYAGSSSAGGAANSVAKPIIVKLNGGSTEGRNLFTFNGSAAKTINITPISIGAAASSHTHSYLPLSGGTLTGDLTGTTLVAKTAMSIEGGNVTNLAAGQSRLFGNGLAISNPATSSDVGWIRVTGTGESDTVLEIATGDNGGSGEQIVVRQYNTSNAVGRELKLLDTSGNSSFPGTVNATTFVGALSGNASSATKLATARTISLGGDLSGSASFNGSANITISASVTAMTNTEIDKLFA